MAKVSIKSKKISPFEGIFHVRAHFSVHPTFRVTLLPLQGVDGFHIYTQGVALGCALLPIQGVKQSVNMAALHRQRNRHTLSCSNISSLGIPDEPDKTESQWLLPNGRRCRWFCQATLHRRNSHEEWKLQVQCNTCCRKTVRKLLMRKGCWVVTFW